MQEINERYPPLGNAQRKILRPILLEKHNNKCANCGREDDLQIDHIVARSVGGTNDISNLQILCGKCNRKKTGAYRPGCPKLNRKRTDRKKTVSLPKYVLDELKGMAIENRMLVKPYMEKVLIEHVKGKK